MGGSDEDSSPLVRGLCGGDLGTNGASASGTRLAPYVRSAPMYPPDGRYLWDGRQWVPIGGWSVGRPVLRRAMRSANHDRLGEGHQLVRLADRRPKVAPTHVEEAVVGGVLEVEKPAQGGGGDLAARFDLADQVLGLVVIRAA